MDLCCGKHGSPLSLTFRDYAALWLRAELMANAEGSGAEIVIFAPMIAILSSVANHAASMINSGKAHVPSTTSFIARFAQDGKIPAWYKNG
jgi:hypothetical protein